MESIISASQDHLIDALNFKADGRTANFVNDRSESTYWPSGGSSYSPGTVNEIKFTISGTGFVDLSSLWVSALITNHDATAGNVLRPVTCGAHCLYSQAIIRVAGVEAERQESFSRLME